MEILISKNKRIVGVRTCWVYQIGRISKTTKKLYWTDKYFYSTLAHAYNDLLEEFVRTEIGKDLKITLGAIVKKLEGLKLKV